MQAERQPDYPLLYSLAGLPVLRPALDGGGACRVADHAINSKPENRETPRLLTRAVSRARCADAQVGRSCTAAFTPHHRPRPPHPGPRRALRGHPRGIRNRAIRNPKLKQAVAGLRRAGTQHCSSSAASSPAPGCGISPARTGPESAQSDLDEAWEIAERGPMRLFLADIHLYRARLFGPRKAETKYPWESPQADLAAARKLIDECGYHRRKEELADAEEAAKGW